MEAVKEISPLMEDPKKEPTPVVGGEGGSYTFLLAIVVICLVLFLMFHAYSCFCVNQEIEPYINEQPRTDPQSDKAFDVDSEVRKLTQMQEQYLEKIQRDRMGNG